VQRPAGVRPGDQLAQQEVGQELVGAELHEPLHLALATDARDRVAGAPEDRLDEGLGDAALQVGDLVRARPPLSHPLQATL